LVEIQSYAINHSSQHWHDPFAYRPERWLPETDNEPGQDAGQDNLEAMQPFNVGPRNCLGRKWVFI
jgi:cytochrome P450